VAYVRETDYATSIVETFRPSLHLFFPIALYSLLKFHEEHQRAASEWRQPYNGCEKRAWYVIVLKRILQSTRCVSPIGFWLPSLLLADGSMKSFILPPPLERWPSSSRLLTSRRN